MALTWYPVNHALVNAMATLANSSWDRDALDVAWLGAGWPLPPGGSVIRYVIDDEKWPWLAVGDWEIAVSWDDGGVRAFAAAFGLYYEPDDISAPDEDPDLVEFPQHTPSDRWSVDRSANRERFNAVWQEGYNMVVDQLGRPEFTGDHGEEGYGWQHAVWRVGPRLLLLAQDEDPVSYSLYDAATLQVLDFPSDRSIPRGNDLHALLV